MSKVIAEYNDIKAVADAIRTKKQITGNMLLKDMPSNVLSIDGTDTSDATATEDDITVGTTAYTSAGLTSGANTYKKLETDAEVESQAELMEQIVAALEGKSAGSGSSNTVTITTEQIDSAIFYFDVNGAIQSMGSYSTYEVLFGVFWADNSSYYSIESDNELLYADTASTCIWIATNSSIISYW